MTRPVEPEKLERILEAARLAPSACNAQPWKFVVINDPELSVKVGKATAGLGMNKFAKDAPVHILVVEESMNVTSFLGAKIKDKYFPLIDIGIATAHITLAAESEGLGSCILGWFDEKEIKKLTGIPSSKRLLLVITIGYQPSMDINKMNVALLLDRLDTHGSEDFKIDKDKEFSEQWEVLMNAREEYYKSASHVLLKDL